MKRIFAVAAAVLLIAALLCGCDSNVKTTVDAKYADDFAKNYASDVQTDENGNVTYEFTQEKYDEFLDAYLQEVKEEVRSDLTVPHQYEYFDPTGQDVKVGIDPKDFDEAACTAEAQEIGERFMKYLMNTENPTGVITVTYVNAMSEVNVTEELLSVEVKAE